MLSYYICIPFVLHRVRPNILAATGLQSMSRDVGYTLSHYIILYILYNIIKYNYPKKHAYRLKLCIYNNFHSKNAYVKLSLKILSRRWLPRVLGSRGQSRMGQTICVKKTQFPYSYKD